MGAPTSVAALLGTHPSGPLNQATLINSFAAFTQQFGTVAQGSRAGTLLYGVQGFFENGGQSLYVVRVANEKPVSYSGNRTAKTGIYALDGISGFNLLVLPGVSEPAVLSAASVYGAQRGAFFIIDSPGPALTPAQISSVISGGSIRRSDQSAVYYPWLSIPDLFNGNKPIMFPPSGHVAGIYANTDATKGVWQAPAGLTARLNGVLGLSRSLTDTETVQLSALGVNCLRTFPANGPVVWGARTLQPAGQTPPQFSYLPVRRFALFIEQSIVQGTAWAVFEPNSPPLWAQLRQSVSGFLTQLYQRGAFQGATPSAAFFVKCDAETVTQNDINQGIVNIVVGIAALRPAEFVIIKIAIRAGKG